MSKKVISVSIDLGSDTTKAAYSYLNEKGNYVFELMFEKGAGIPSMAYYDTEKSSWIFDKREILQRAQSSFCYLVKVKELLDLFFTRAEDNLYTSNYFKKFYYPPKESESYADAVRNDRCFVAADTPREVCALFVKHCVGKIEKEIVDRFGDVAIRYVVVYPANAPKDYIKELVGFVTDAATMTEDVYIISAPRAVGISAKEYGVLSKEKNVLLFNIGEEEISVVKMFFDKSNISVYSADGHSSPAKIGGRDFDLALASHLFERSAGINAFGDLDAGQEVEKGIFFDQFRMQEGIKAGKKVFSNGGAYQRLGGFVFSIYREMITSVKVVREEYRECCTPVYQKIWEYVREELTSGDNADVDAIIFSGGAADTYGLDKYVEAKMKGEFPKVSFLDFSPANDIIGYDDLLCEAKDTVPIGAALYGAGKYRFKLLTTFAYGTYKGAKNEKDCAFDQFVKKGEEIDLEGKLDFKIEMMAQNALAGKPKIYDGKCLIFNEYYKCTSDPSYDSANPMHEFVFDRGYRPSKEFKTKDTAGELTFPGIFWRNGVSSAVTFKRIGCYLMIYTFPKDFKGDREVYGHGVRFKEGFEIDFEGRVTPIVKNVSEQHYREKNRMGEFLPIYREIVLTLVPNGTRVMSINN